MCHSRAAVRVNLAPQGGVKVFIYDEVLCKEVSQYFFLLWAVGDFFVFLGDHAISGVERVPRETKLLAQKHQGLEIVLRQGYEIVQFLQVSQLVLIWLRFAIAYRNSWFLPDTDTRRL